MDKRLISLAEQVLFVLAVFIGFLLLFEEQLVLPAWLQAVGRMHPLFLHFPIVILLLAMLMEAFRFGGANSSNRTAEPEFYRNFLTNLLLIGLLSAGVTVVMGLFLAREDGYTGRVLNWHKWSGVGIFYVAGLVYWGRSKAWYNAPLARVSALTTILLLIGAGHYGATLTHGDNFILEPLASQTKAAPVPLDRAYVFANVIQPIFEQKCVSCHGVDKVKGGLMLTDAQSIQKGGKTGKLYVAGRPDISLLLRRIHLPMDEKKHMPPAGKTQLTPQEITLLALWVKGRADFIKRVVDLPANDSLRFIASTLFKPTEPSEDYPFDAADEETVSELNNDYRTIAPLARESPALAVNLYSPAAYSPDRLAELKAIRAQVVSLNLNKLPVKDADLKQVRQFENLQKLDLNFTDITGAGLAELTPLKQLKTLALSGTKVTYADLRRQMGQLKNLRTVSVWETALTPAEVGQMAKAFPNVEFIAGFDGNRSEPIKLNPPQVGNASTIFNQSVAVQLKHPVKGVQIRYTTDGTEPDSLTSPVFTGKTVLREAATIRARAYKPGWFGSSVAQFDFYRSTYKPDSVNVLLPLSPVHQAEGTRSFFDGKLGTFNANSPAWANNWLGVRKNDMVLVTEFKQPVPVSAVTLRTMIEPETGIFPPAVVEVWGGNSREQMKLLATQRPAMPAPKSDPVLKAVVSSFRPQTVSFLKIIARPAKLPPWHGGKGNPALVLVDEVFIN